MTFTDNDLRIALGNALISLNNETIVSSSKKERIILNKLALKLISNILKELNIKTHG